ncbi:MAG: hypothetical protein ACE5HE_09715 [Phycisphaerae bacterium]
MDRMYGLTRPARCVLGGALWVAALAAIGTSLHVVRARTARAVEHLILRSTSGVDLKAGDLVFLGLDRGLVHAGEVSGVTADGQTIALAIDPGAFATLNESTRATYWQTPLSAERAIDALLPPTIQRQAAEQIAADWREHDDALAAAWAPVVAELLSAYLQAVAEDVEASVKRHEGELWSISKAHGRLIAAEWPEIQRRVQPILERHLTPVLSRLLSDALLDAPKVSIAWNIARGRNAEAYQAMLDWLTEYLANMPENDKAELSAAAIAAWEAGKEDVILTRLLSSIGVRILEDERLREVLLDVYRESVSRNPRTHHFIRTKVLQSAELRTQVYAFIELFAPTARKVAALCLFDEDGATRPEVVHLVRSVALGREVCWVTLDTPDADAPPLPREGASLALSPGVEP